MYGFDVEGQEWFLKPMNCPGHCMIFDHRVRSYKELPMRMASFGVLHRNELSGTLSGLTRVRRFQQDDAHIFCRQEQIKVEVIAALDFLYYVYDVFGFEFSIALSTRPKKAIGEKAVWDVAEAALKEALNEAGKEWSLNPGDGAFYGPKIDIRLLDAMRRRHQCGTIQLDFQLPIRFNLQYRAEGGEEEEGDEEDKEAAKAAQAAAKAAEKIAAKEAAQKAKEEAKAANLAKKDGPKAEKPAPKAKEASPKASPKAKPAAAPGAKEAAKDVKDALVVESKKAQEYVWKEGVVKQGFERPVIIHRAILGSVERFVAILSEHLGGKWPFWVSPRQIIVVPISSAFDDYAKYVTEMLVNFGFYAEMDGSNNTLNKKVRNAQIAQWNYAAIVGEQEQTNMSVNLRSRSEKNAIGDFTLADLVKKLKDESEPSSKKFNEFSAFKGKMPEGLDKAAVVSTVKAAVQKQDAKDSKGAAPKAAGSPKGGPAAAPKAAASGDEGFLEQHPYLGGFAPSKKDATLFASLSALPKTANLARWYEHMSSFTAMERQSWA